MSKARQLADLGNVYDDGALSNRNRIVNGDFSIWQRGTSFTPNAVIFGADRFASYKAGASAGDYARSTDVPAGQGFTYSAYFNNADIRHSIELPVAGDRGIFIDGSKWTLSFWVKAGASGTATANLGWANGVSASSLTYWGADQSYSYSTSWEKKTITFTVGGSITGSHAAVLLYMSKVSGLYLTGVQLEVGDLSTATPFEHIPYSDQLARCQRYFQRYGGPNYNRFAMGFIYDPNLINLVYPLPVIMRTVPTVSATGSAGIYNGTGPSVSTVTSVTLETAGSTNACLSINCGSSGLNKGYVGTYIANNDSSARVSFDAEL
jgi:hypothetical protein